MDVTHLNEVVLRTVMPVGDADELHIAYRIGALGPEFSAWLSSPEGGGAAGSIYQAIEMTCVSLDITVDGEPVLCTAEALKAAGVPPQILHAVLAHIRSEANAGKLGVPVWQRGSSPAASSATAPTGTPS